jgi:siroheme synthase-like protein
MARSFPLALKLQDKPCLVVGSSVDAARRARALVESGARVRVVARAASAELEQLSSGQPWELARRPYAATDLAGVWLAVLTDRDFELAERMAADADVARVFFCAVDDPECGSFSHVAIARAGLVTLAVSTEGRAPALGRRLREELERLIDEAGLAEFAAELAELRARTPSETRAQVLGDAVASVHFEGALRLRG